MIGPGTSRRLAPALALAAAVCLVHDLAISRAAAQTAPFAQTEPAADPPAGPPPPAPGGQGAIGAIGKWIDDSLDTMRSNLRGAGESLGAIGSGAGEAARDAATAIGRLPGSGVVAGRERCATTAQGASDCRGAAEALCRSKGLAGGRSLDIQSADKCPARVWLSGRRPAPGECPVESFVTRAMCQ